MPYTVILHIQNSDPVVGDMDELPSPTDNLVMLSNPRMRDGKDIAYLEDNVISVYFPIERISLIEVLASKDEEEIIGFVRE